MWTTRSILWLSQLLCLLFSTAHSAPDGFPKSGNGLWYNTTGQVWSRDWLPIGNGYLAAMVPGGTSQETTQLNIESLWSGGPFADPTYNGGNKPLSEQAATAQIMAQIRQTIFQSTTGDIDNIEALGTDAGQYGSYAGAGHLLSSLNQTDEVTSYARWLDMDTATVHTLWTTSGARLNFGRPEQPGNDDVDDAHTHALWTTSGARLNRRRPDESGETDHTTIHDKWTTSGARLNRKRSERPVNEKEVIFRRFERTSFCSNPTRACVEHIVTNDTALPTLTYAFTTALESGLPAPNITCASSNSLLVDGFVSDPGMSYAVILRAFSSSSAAKFRCVQQPVASGAAPNATLTLLSTKGVKDAWVTWIGDTNYDMDAGDAPHAFSFKGVDPVTRLKGTSANGLYNYAVLLKQHVDDVKSVLSDSFALDLGQKPDLDKSTDVLKANYAIDGPASNAYLDWLLFNYGRYMLASSSRGVLPANLQGKWGNGIGNAWGADYHSNINIQMNYWIAEMTGLGQLAVPLFDYFQKTWAPRGAQTAQVLYNITRGWVTHNEMNIFGHTGMKAGGNSAQWADYPESAVWMMIHVWDHFDHTNDVAWWKSQGWPLVKGVASFHLDKLIPDLHFNDSTLVVSPCNSPEQTPITFGCAHAQQMIWQLFNAVEKGFNASGDSDVAFLEEVRAKRAKMDKGLKIGSWGQLQEWKIDQDSPTDTHRHLSHLIGLYPGYAITNFDSSPAAQGTGPAATYNHTQIIDAATVSLIHRGNGTGPDADSGWEKAWRAAAWAQLGDSKTFYHELSFAVQENFGDNLFSLYDPADADPIFQIDANFGVPAAILNALVQAPDVASLNTPLTITLLPALPPQWAASGSIRGARVRGGIAVDFAWKAGKLSKATLTVDGKAKFPARPVRVMSGGRLLASFTTSPGLVKKL